MGKYVNIEDVKRIISQYHHSPFMDMEIDCLQTEDVVPVRQGKWLIKPRGYSEKKCGIVKICSACGWENACRYNYCPMCGAVMGKEEWK